MTSLQIRTSLTSCALAAIMLLALSGCGSKNNEQNTPPVNGNSTSDYVVPVQVAVAQQNGLAVTKLYSGSLEGEEQATIVGKISERVTNVFVHVGQSVRSGQVLLALDKSGATSQYYQAEANYKNAERNLERMKSLFGEGAISQQTLDGVQTAFDVAKANFDAARSTVDLTTPITGLVTAVNVNAGDLATPGAVLATVARIGQMKVIFNINETDVTNLAVGQTVKVSSEARPDVVVEGKVSQLSKSADIGSRTFEVKAVFPNTKDAWFKPGMFCKVNVPLTSRGKAIVIPAAAVQYNGTTAQVFLVRNGRAASQAVQAGVSDGQNVEILQGLKAGDTVATVGVNNLRDSTLVSVVSK